MTSRVQVVAQRRVMGRVIAQLIPLESGVFARSQFEPGPEDLDEFGEFDVDDLSIADIATTPERVARTIEKSIAGIESHEVLVVDATGRRLQLRWLPAAGKHRVVVKTAEGVTRFDGRRRRQAARMVESLLRDLERRGQPALPLVPREPIEPAPRETIDSVPHEAIAPVPAEKIAPLPRDKIAPLPLRSWQPEEPPVYPFSRGVMQRRPLP
jgi:hypothetical protein